jgi:exopolyphosphatase/guanosine-5'-triphosphate,3'-diphosphate pyrophosphatase
MNYRNPYYAAIDVGSNAIRLYIARPDLRKGFSEKFSKRFELRLGRDVFQKHRIGKASLQRLVEIFTEIATLLRKHETPSYIALATSALREARNRAEVIDTVYERSGIRIQILSPHGEGQTIRHAVNHVHRGSRRKLILDLGGGSLEIVCERADRPPQIQSFPLGAVRLLQQYPKAPQAFEKSFLRVLNPALPRWGKLYKANLWQKNEVIGTGGNIRALLKIWQKLHTSHHANFLRVEDLTELHERLSKLSSRARQQRFKLSSDRADVVVPAARVFLIFLHHFGYDRIVVPKVSLKNGMIMLLARRKIKPQKLAL